MNRLLNTAAFAAGLATHGWIGYGYLGPHPLAELIGREHEVAHEGGRSVAIPLPHPSGASSWIHAPGNRALLDRALALLAERLRSDVRRSVA